jgi:hypothetical protein
MRNLMRRALIAGAGALVLVSVGGPAELPGYAHADNPQCVADTTNPCPGDGPGALASQPRPETTVPETRTVCKPAGRFGAFCYRQELRSDG